MLVRFRDVNIRKFYILIYYYRVKFTLFSTNNPNQLIMNALDIKKHRKKLNLTQLDLAKKIGVSLKTVSNYENGGSIPDTIKQLLRIVLNIDEPEIKKDPFTSHLFYNLPEKQDLLKLQAEIQAQIEAFSKTIETLKHSISNIEQQLKMIEITEEQQAIADKLYDKPINENEY